MTKGNLFAYIKQNFSATAEYLWQKYPDFAIFRHAKNKKWFALYMPIDGKKLSVKAGREVETITLKCDPALREALLQKDGIYQAYHMNKTHWLTQDISAVSEEDIKSLLEISFSLTEK